MTRAWAAAHRVAPRWLDALSCLASPYPRGGPPPAAEMAWRGSFEELERAAFRTPDLPEIDAEQASIFRRRLDAVRRRLREAGDPASRVLAVGLDVRLAGMAAAERGCAELQDPSADAAIVATGAFEPQGTRVRALADFYYSLAAQLECEQRGETQPLASAAAALRWRRLDVGLEHALYEGPGPMGPMHINMLRIEVRRWRPVVLDMRDGSGDLAAEARARGAPAATSGGFFLYSEPDITPPSQRGDPVGMLISEGRVVNPPWLPRGALVAGRDWVDVGVVQADVETFTRADGLVGPDAPSLAMLGDQVIGEGQRLAVPLNGAIIPARTRLPLPTPSFRGQQLVNAVAGGPMLLEAGHQVIDFRAEGFWGSAPPITFSQDETGDRNLLPRLAAGIDAEGRALMAAVDGRHFERALGMTLGQLAEWMRLAGCHRAVNLDGGSSKRMVVEGEIVDLASTEVQGGEVHSSVRPVRCGVFWHPR